MFKFEFPFAVKHIEQLSTKNAFYILLFENGYWNVLDKISDFICCKIKAVFTPSSYIFSASWLIFIIGKMPFILRMYGISMGKLRVPGFQSQTLELNHYQNV